MSRELDIRGLGAALPQGPAKADDATIFTTGVVYTVDPVGRRVQVGVREGTVWLPAMPARYSGESGARVLIDPFTSRPVLVLGAVDPRDPVVAGTVTGTWSGGVTVSVDDTSYNLAAFDGTYTAGQSAWVMLDDWGVPQIIMGPSTAELRPPSGAAPPTGGGTVAASVTLGPQWSGTYRAAYSRWDSWNTNRYGGRSDVYQGDNYGSGLLLGLAAFGDQIANLGAVSITSMVLKVRKTDDGNTAALTVQCSPSGSQPGGAPSYSGDAPSTGAIGSGGWGSVALTAPMCEAFRTGAAKGLVAVGGSYAGFGGTATPGSFVMDIQYTKNV